MGLADLRFLDLLDIFAPLSEQTHASGNTEFVPGYSLLNISAHVDLLAPASLISLSLLFL